MINAFKISLKLKNTYKTNSIIYSLKSVSILKRLLPQSLYASSGLKTFANVLSILYEIATFFTGKVIYIGLMVFLASEMMKNSGPDSFIHILFFLTLIGAVLNTHMFTPTRDKYYAIFLMRMDAKKYALSNYYYFLFKTVAGLLPVVIIFGLLAGVSIWICLLFPFFVAAAKLIAAAFTLHDSIKKNKRTNEILENSLAIGIVIALLICAYVPAYFGYVMNEMGFLIICFFFLLAGIVAFRYIFVFNQYKQIYKGILTMDTIAPTNVQKAAKIKQSTYLKKLDITAQETSKKTGYAYFNDLFMKRHRRLLTKSAKKITLAEMVLLATAIAGCLIFEDINQHVNNLMLTYLPYFLFVLYLLNRGKVITEAMFMNCDHSMLAYRFYRQPKVILELFAARLKSVILINLMPAVVIAVGLPLLLFVTGGTDQVLNYGILAISIIAMSIFFSVHNMVLYYLLQPYNVDLQIKNPTYSAISSLTYFICYFAIGKKVPTLVFGGLITAFCVLYVIVALVLVYRLAPKTFKLRQ